MPLIPTEMMRRANEAAERNKTMRKKEKVTDLEKFCLTHVYRPYQTEIGIDGHLKGLSKEYSLNNAVEHLENNPAWAELVLDRIYRIGFRFPKYIKHPLVKYIKAYCEQREAHAALAEQLVSTMFEGEQ